MMVPSSSIATAGDGITNPGAINASGTSGWVIRVPGTCILVVTSIANGLAHGFTCGSGTRIHPGISIASGMARGFINSPVTCIHRSISIGTGRDSGLISRPGTRRCSAIIMVTATTGSGRALTRRSNGCGLFGEEGDLAVPGAGALPAVV